MASSDEIPPSLEADFVVLRKLRDASDAPKALLGDDHDPRKWGDDEDAPTVRVADGRVVKIFLYNCKSPIVLPAEIGKLKGASSGDHHYG